jgi:biopolymer transport protein TolR
VARLHSKRGPLHEINVVPYIDVMLVLLVIFMVTAPLVTPGVIDLPSVSKAPTAPVGPVEVVIREDRSITLQTRDTKGAVGEKRTVTLKQLVERIRELQAKNPDQPVLVAGDKNVRYQAVLDVMDELHRMQVRRVGLLVKAAR